jgi:hypothetical protein
MVTIKHLFKSRNPKIRVNNYKSPVVFTGGRIFTAFIDFFQATTPVLKPLTRA